MIYTIDLDIKNYKLDIPSLGKIIEVRPMAALTSLQFADGIKSLVEAKSESKQLEAFERVKGVLSIVVVEDYKGEMSDILFSLPDEQKALLLEIIFATARGEDPLNIVNREKKIKAAKDVKLIKHKKPADGTQNS